MFKNIGTFHTMFFMIITSFLCMQLQATDQTIASAYPQAYTWCIQTQHELCPDKYKTISYKIGSSWKAFAIENCIYIPEDAAQDLESLSTKNNLSHAEEIQLQKYKGLLAHEIGHILYDNDPLNLGIMFATSAFLTYSTDYVIQDTGLLIRLFTCIFTGTTSLYAANFVRKQYQEISADNFVIQTKDFDAIVGLYKELEASTPQNLAKACLQESQHTQNLLLKLYYYSCSWLCAQSWVPEDVKYVLWDQNHPSHTSRIDKLKKALSSV